MRSSCLVLFHLCPWQLSARWEVLLQFKPSMASFLCDPLYFSLIPAPTPKPMGLEWRAGREAAQASRCCILQAGQMGAGGFSRLMHRESFFGRLNSTNWASLQYFLSLFTFNLSYWEGTQFFVSADRYLWTCWHRAAC